MTIPGLALFYGGLVRAKNMLSVLMQVFAGFSHDRHPLGDLRLLAGLHRPDRRRPLGLHRRFLKALPRRRHASTRWSATFSAGVDIPELTFVVFQLTFAIITPALIVGAIAERMKFGAVMLFLAIWFTFSYLPIAHMVWFGGGFLVRPRRL